jgi:hypothetical protein
MANSPNRKPPSLRVQELDIAIAPVDVTNKRFTT